MIDNQEIFLIVLGAGVALVSSLATVVVQNFIEQRNKKAQEKIAKQKMVYEAKIEGNIEKSMSEKDSHVSQVLEKLSKIDEELSTRDLSSVSTEKLTELYLAYAQYALAYEDWVKIGIRNEAEKVNVLGVNYYRELRFGED